METEKFLNVFLFFCKIKYQHLNVLAPIAQWIEHLPSKQGI